MPKVCNFTVVLTPAEEGGYVVTVPALPAIVTEGDSYEEALFMARDAIELYVGYLIDKGEPVPVESVPMIPLHTSVQIELPAA